MNNPTLEKKKIDDFQNQLLAWYEENKRVLPWRFTKNPYYIWISEVMLQQTQVDTVIPYYEKFVKEFPTPYDLAKAPQEQVLKLWEGLGYYSRARNLQDGVREVVRRYGGEIPDDKKEVLNIKGIGPYTAGAILSIAYGKKEPAVDGNVMRVLSRIFLIDQDITQVKTRRHFESLLYGLIPDEEASSFNQGLMELGALICKPRNPQCDTCPLENLCQAHAIGTQTDFPVKKKAKDQKAVNLATAVLYDSEGKILIEKRPETGLLASLWEFPMIELPKRQPKDLVSYCENKYMTEKGINVSLEKTDLNLNHTFSHLKWNVSLFNGKLKKPLINNTNPDLRLVPINELQNYPFPVVHQKVIKTLSLQ